MLNITWPQAWWSSPLARETSQLYNLGTTSGCVTEYCFSIRFTDAWRFVVRLPRCDECHQHATVRRHSVHNTWRSHRWQHAMKRDTNRKKAIFVVLHLHLTPLLGESPSGKKLEWCGYLKVKKLQWLLILTQCTNVTDSKTDRRTDTAWRHRIGRAYAQHRAAKTLTYLFSYLLKNITLPCSIVASALNTNPNAVYMSISK